MSQNAGASEKKARRRHLEAKSADSEEYSVTNRDEIRNRKYEKYYDKETVTRQNAEKKTQLVWPSVMDQITTHSNALYHGWTIETREAAEETDQQRHEDIKEMTLNIREAVDSTRNRPR